MSRDPARMTGIRPHERAIMFVLECLCAACAVASFVAVVIGEGWLAAGWAALAVCCYEGAGELDP